MTINKLRGHLTAKPFRPIIVRTVSGARHPVNHPDYLLIPPVGDTIFIVETDGTVHHIDISHIEAVETKTTRPKSTG